MATLALASAVPANSSRVPFQCAAPGISLLQVFAIAAQARLEAQRREDLRSKLHTVLLSMAKHIRLQSINLLQVWFAGSAVATHSALYADPALVLMGDDSFRELRRSSCAAPQDARSGMPSRVWRSGCVQVVQNAGIIPPHMHPCSGLSAEQAAGVALVYVPVYDTGRPQEGPVAVLEALLSSESSDSMLVANFISLAGSVLSSLQLSLSNPLPQPVQPSQLAGRRARPPSDERPDDAVEEEWQRQQQHVAGVQQEQEWEQQQRASQQQVDDAQGADIMQQQQQQQEVYASEAHQPASSSSCAAGPAKQRRSSEVADSTTPAGAGRKRAAAVAWQSSRDDGGVGQRPHKVRRSLSMLRTKSTPNLLAAEVASAQLAPPAVNKPAQSC